MNIAAASQRRSQAATKAVSYLTHLECSETGKRIEAAGVRNLSPAGAPLLARYDLEAIAKAVSRDDIAARPRTMWRYGELLPHFGVAEPVSLRESMTPLVALPSVASKGGELLVKDEGRLPTGSFKARGLAMAVTMARAAGLKRLAMPTNGNAGAALAAYAARAGIEAFLFCPEETPEINVREIAAMGAHVWRVNGQIHDCGRVVAQGRDAMAWHDISTLKEPWRVEGKKTMAFELAEQLGWEAPAAIFYPTGGGTGLIGMWKAFQELKTLGWIEGDGPKMVAVQSTGCGPIVKAWEEGAEKASEWENPKTMVNGVRVPVAFADRLMLRTIRESDGFAVAVSDAEVTAARDEAARADGMLLCPEGAATLAAWRKALSDGRVGPGDRVVLFNSQSALKTELPAAAGRLELGGPIDYAALAG